ncbi:MAG: TAXI family TRAP transporter solute-binding subunit [Campylobacterota bacterium]|nr:TAXI family TRAP transporter solute-binding subunit [Campylobacterota bacterium]
MQKLIGQISKVWIIIFFILSIVVFIVIQLTSPISEKKLTIATGAIGSDSYAYAMSYKALLEQEGVDLDIVPTQGSLDTVGYLHSKKVDIGFVHSGVLLNKREYDFESLASIYHEPLWIFYRNDGYEMNYIIEATGKKVGISLTNDGTYDLAEKLSKVNGLTQNKYTSYIDDSNALGQLKGKSIDIFITLATKDNQYIQKLLSDPSIEVMNVKRLNAYLQKFEYLTYLNLYEGSIDLYKNLPSKDIKILSTTQNLISNKNVPDELIRILLKKAKQIHGQLSLEHLDTQVNIEAKLYVINGETWLETIFPYWIASNIDRLKLLLIPLIWLIIPLLKSIIPLYSFTNRAKIFKWYNKLDEINKNIDKKIIIQDIKDIKNEVESKIKVPLSYKGEYYNLIVHLELLEKKVIKRDTPL